MLPYTNYSTKDFDASYSKETEEQGETYLLHYYHIDIYNGLKKLYKITIEDKEIDLMHQEALMHPYETNAVYTMVLLGNPVITAHYR